MKKFITTTLAILAGLAGLAASAVAPWWAVWFICLPVTYLAALYLISRYTNNIKEY